MKRKRFFVSLLFAFLAEIAAFIFMVFWDIDSPQDSVAVNEVFMSVQDGWDDLDNYNNNTGLDYVVLDIDGNVKFRTRKGLRESVNKAVIHRDTILMVNNGKQAAGRIIIYNNSINELQEQKNRILVFLLVVLSVQCIVCIGYMFYLENIVIKPFKKLKGFAVRIAAGNLDFPLEMDRINLFGAFTESFDVMRDELKRSRIAEARAEAEKRELVAELSHDIKTPVASIKAASELGLLLADSDKVKDNYQNIIYKADQVSALVTNLFTAALDELDKLSVTPGELESAEVFEMLMRADYLGYASIPGIPECLVFADRLRLQQVFDNLFANSYKYAGTKIDVTADRGSSYLAIILEDYGGGISAEELPLLKEKFKRGSNTQDTDGAGLGLYLSDYFLREMQGELVLENGQNGLRAVVNILLCGTT